MFGRNAQRSASDPPPLPPREGRGEGTNDLDLLPTPATSREHLEPVRAGHGPVPAWLGPAPKPRDVFLHCRPYDPGLYSDAGFGPPHRLAGELFAIRRGDWKYIEGVEQNVNELYILATDPAERHNFIATSPPIATHLRRALHAWLTANLRVAEQRGSLSPEDRARLEALGYVELVVRFGIESAASPPLFDHLSYL